jgi:CheY-like chemotaxis protein
MATPERPIRVLLVDDDESSTEALASYCRGEGLEAEVAPTAESGLELIRSCPPDVVVLDYSMPGMSGIDLLNVLREDPRLRAIPVIMVSGRDRDLRSVHGAPWLRKPVPPPELIDHVRRAVAEAAGPR